MIFHCIVEERQDHDQGVWKANGNQNSHSDNSAPNYFHLSLDAHELIGTCDMCVFISLTYRTSLR